LSDLTVLVENHVSVVSVDVAVAPVVVSVFGGEFVLSPGMHKQDLRVVGR